MSASKLLLDTHVFLWWRGDPIRLTAEAHDAISGAEMVFVSAASAWEAAIKVTLGKLELPDTLEAGVEASGFEKLFLTFSHVEGAAGLPLHHRDPFDRLLVAQARSERLVLVTHDRLLAPYEVEIVWA